MRTTIDGAGRIVVPKQLRVALGLHAGSEVEITEDGSGLRLEPVAPRPRLEEREGKLVIVGDPGIVVTDEDIQAIRDALRR